MHRLLLSVIATAFVTTAFAAESETKPLASGPLRVYELRAIQASPGKLDVLHSRLRDHQIPLLKEHGVFTEAVFVPAGENPQEVVYLLTAAEGLGPMEEGWTGLRKDRKWLKVIVDTDSDGQLVAQERNQRLVTTSWSPQFKPEHADEPRVFELRTYMCPDPSKHAALMRRFHDHTMKLFEKHGMQNIVYWVPDEEPQSQQRLVYLLAHKSQEAAKASFVAFRADPNWLAAKKASEETAGGLLTVKENGVLSEFLVPAEYSPLR